MLARSATGVRPSSYAYMLIEVLADRSVLRELFRAPSDSEAVERVQDVVEGQAAELWCDGRVVWRWKRRAAEPAQVDATTIT